MAKGNPVQIGFSPGEFFPALKSLDSYSLFAAVLLAFGGLEMSAVHAKEVKNPQKDYPKAIFLSTVIILVVLSLSALSIAIWVSCI